MSVARQARTLALRPVVPRVNAQWLLRVAAVVGVCLVPILLYIPFLYEPFMRDEGFYASVAQSLLHGGIPYRDAFDNKPPLIFGWYAASFLLFGENVWAPRLLAALLLSATAGLVYLQGRLLFSHAKALLAAAVFAASIGLASFETNANTEYFMLLPMTAALVCFTLGQQRGGWGWYLASGFLSGAAIMTKETSQFAFLLFVGLAMWPAVRSRGWRALSDHSARNSAAALIAGCAIAGAVTIAPFVATGTFGAFFDAVVIYTLQYVGDVPFYLKLFGVLRAPAFLFVFAGPLTILVAFALYHCLRRGHSREWLLAAWLAAGFVGIFAAGRFYNHYYAQLLPAAALLAPVGLDYLKSRWQDVTFRRAMLVVLPVLALLCLIGNGDIYLKATPAERHEAKYRFTEVTTWETQSPALAAYLRQNTQPTDFIYNLGYQSELYFYADRRSPSRFLFDFPFAVDKKFELEALHELQANPPLYVVDSARYGPDPRDGDRYYATRIKAWVDSNYVFVGHMYYADVYRLASAPGR